jgi:hypothetical protein
MDPYLESPQFWRGFHNGLIFVIQAALNAVLPPGFAANAEERVYLIPPERSIYPDMMVTQRLPELPPRAQGGSVAVVGSETAHGILTAYPEEIHEPFIEIRSTTNWDRIVTIIEVLSPANKAAIGEGRAEYRQKQAEILRSETHLLEIDLLRGGQHTVAAPLEGLRQRGRWDYLICLHRATNRYHFEYWFNRVSEPLPQVSVPLTADVSDVPLDLQPLLERAYDAGPYRRLADYRQDPPLPLEGEAVVWMDALLREKGLRP